MKRIPKDILAKVKKGLPTDDNEREAIGLELYKKLVPLTKISTKNLPIDYADDELSYDPDNIVESDKESNEN